MRIDVNGRLGRALLAACALWAAAGVQAAAQKVYVGNFKDNTVSVLDGGTGSVVATVPVAAGPHGMVASPDGTRVYVSGDASNAVSVIDTGKDNVSRTIEVGRTPHGLAMRPDGRALLVAVYGEDRVLAVDTATLAPGASVPVLKPHTIAVRPDGRFAYVASQEPGKFALAVIDLSTMAVTHTVPLEKPPRDLEFAHDGKALYLTVAGESAVLVLDPQSDRFVARVSTGPSPHIASWFAGAVAGMAVVQGSNELLLFDPKTYAAVGSVVVGKQPHWLAADASGGTVYVTNEGSNDLSIIDVASRSVRTVAVGNAPRKVVVPRARSGGQAGVSIKNFEFGPRELVIDAGQSVVWRNDDGAPHSLAFKDGANGADLLLPGAQFSRRFDDAGSYDYICAVHPYMSGKVVVRRQTAAASIATR